MGSGKPCCSWPRSWRTRLGVRPEVRFEGAVDNAVPQHVGDHVLAVVREGLTNAGKHSQASRYEVTLGVTDRVVLELLDDGIGIELPLTTPGLGLINLRDRAEKLRWDVRDPPDGTEGAPVWCGPFRSGDDMASSRTASPGRLKQGDQEWSRFRLARSAR